MASIRPAPNNGVGIRCDRLFALAGIWSCLYYSTFILAPSVQRLKPRSIQKLDPIGNTVIGRPIRVALCFAKNRSYSESALGARRNIVTAEGFLRRIEFWRSTGCRNGGDHLWRM